MKNAIIVDIDGTIADRGNRSPYDWGKVGDDKPIKCVINLLDIILKNTDLKILFVSGRDEICRNDTAKWLLTNIGIKKSNAIPTKLFMRPHKDNRPDVEIKREIYDNHIKDKYNVLFVIDDRPSLIRMWRSLGLFVFDINQTGKEF